MKNFFTKSFYSYLILSLLIVSCTYATNPSLKELLTISNAKIISYDESTKTAVIEYKVEAKENFSGTLKVSAPNSVSDIQLRTMTEGINISKSVSENRTFSIQLPDNDVSYFSLNISIPTASDRYKKEYYRYFKIIKSGSDVKILDPREETELKPKEVGKDINVVNETESPLGPESMNYTVNISGRIIIDQLSSKGLFGNGVRLWFRNSANPGTWYHPSINEQINVTYDLLDEQGNFNFNFSFTGDLSSYNQAIVIINTANDAAYLPAPPDGYISWGPHGFTYYFNESEGVIASINGSNSNIIVNQNGIKNREDGSILRYMQLAREFTIQRYSGNPPFSIPQIQTFNAETEPGVGGYFHVDGSTHYIVINPNSAEMATITHEYGHYINYRMWGNSNTHWFLASDDLVEGWAIFYCFATRSYINKMYGDNVNTFDDNTEYSPFYIGPTNGFGNLRYANIRYVYWRNEPMKAACACNIWNLYDSYDGGNFEMTTYAGDNDDVSGYGTLVFEAMRSLDMYNSTVSSIHFAFYNAVPTELRQSVVDINFFMYDNLTSIPSHKMKSSQIINPGLTNISPTQIKLNWLPQSYPGSYIEVNAPIEYRIYKNVSGTWQTVATSQFGTNYVDLPLAGSSGLYKFTAYNSSGDSYGSIERQIYNVTLPTANYIEPGSGGYYKINGTNMGHTWSGAYLQNSGPITIQAVPPSGFVFVGWSDGSTINPRQISSGDINLYAIYKGLQLSNQTDAYNSNSQRKAIKTADGHLHNVYESMNKIWYERSTDNGATWMLENNGEPLSTNEAKLPSMHIWGSGSAIAIVWQEKKWDSYKIKLAYNLSPTWQLTFKDVHDEAENSEYPDLYTVDAIPVVGWGSSHLLVCWKKNNYPAGLKYRYGTVSPYSPLEWKTPGFYAELSETNSSSTNPSIAINNSVYPPVFHLTWQQGSIKYLTITPNEQHQLTISSTETVSASSGYKHNMYPSISLANGNPIISWTGENNSDEEIPLTERRTLVRIKRGSIWSDIQVAGNNVNYTNNNSATSSTEKTVIVWSEGTGNPQSKWIKRTGGLYSYPVNLSHSGIQAQVINGNDYGNMTSIVFNNITVPHFFTKTTTNFSDDEQRHLGKITSVTDTIVTFGRAGIVNINGVDFVFNTGDIIVDDNIISFIEKPDTIVYQTDEELNQYTKSEPFELNNSSSFYFSNIYYTLNKEYADSALTENDNVNFKAELVRVNDGQVVGVFDNITYSKNNLNKYANISYQVDCSGIQAGEYYLRLVTTVEGTPSYALANIMNESTVLEKISGSRMINFTGNEKPVTYELYQNFPNPFNPSTTIRYQVPADGVVTLKIYDILGKEVTTLVNEQKTTGKYELNFDAGSLASGVYIYRIQVNSASGGFVSSKKMMLVK